MKDLFLRLRDFINVPQYPALDELRYVILKIVFLFTIACGVVGVIYAILFDNMAKTYWITIPIIGVCAVGLFFLSRLKLDYTAGVIFGVIYMAVYMSGHLGMMEPNIVILFLNSILVLAMFFIKNRLVVLIAYVIGIIANLKIIWHTEWIIYEYLAASFVFLILFYSVSSLIYSFQERLEKENKIIQTKNEKINVLLNEIHFRVNNNLQTISSLLYLQSSYIPDKEAKEAITKGQQRVESMALIHKNLYQNGNHTGIEMSTYLSSLLKNLMDAYGLDKNIRVNLEVDKKELNIDTAIPIGLIMNELITNAIKYAFLDRTHGELNVKLKVFDLSKFSLGVKDSGVGRGNVQEGFGSQLIMLLTQQLGANFNDGNDNGYWCKINN